MDITPYSLTPRMNCSMCVCGFVLQLEKQRKLNELDVVVTLFLHQMEHVVNRDLPGDLSPSIVLEASTLLKLHCRIEELEQERVGQKRQHQYG